MSSNVKSAERVGGDVVVTFVNGGKYTYHDVPDEVFVEYSKAESKGSFVAKNLRGKFRTRKHEEER